MAAQPSELPLYEKFCVFDCFGGGVQNKQQLILKLLKTIWKNFGKK